MSTAVLFIELGAFLTVLAFIARYSSRIGLSPIPLYLLIGLAVGEGGIVPLVTAEDFIRTGSHIGVVLLMFMLGLEYDPAQLVAKVRAGVGASVVDLVANAAPGLVLGRLLGWDWTASIVLAGVTYATSSGIVAKVIEDFGWRANPETPAILSLLVAEDLALAVYLPLVGALIAGGSPLIAATTALVSIAVALGAVVITARFGERIGRWMADSSPEAIVLGLLGTSFIVAGAAERLRVSAAIGAFLVGVALAGPIAASGTALLRPLRDLFAATFFVFFAFEVDPRTIPPVAAIAAGLAVVTGATKYLTGWLATRGIADRAARVRAGTLLLPRGEFSIVIAELGVVAGLEPRLGPLSVAYVLMLAIAGPVAVRVFHRPKTAAVASP